MKRLSAWVFCSLLTKMKRTLLFALFSILASTSIADCRIQWVDHDYDTTTPAIHRQICDSTLDIPAINLPGVQPIQQPAIKPIEAPTIPPIGTSSCQTQQVYENGTWVSKKLCS